MKSLIPALILVAASLFGGGMFYYTQMRECPLTLTELCLRPPSVRRDWELTTVKDTINSSVIRRTGCGYDVKLPGLSDGDEVWLQYENETGGFAEPPELKEDTDYKLTMYFSNEHQGNIWSDHGCWTLEPVIVEDEKECVESWEVVELQKQIDDLRAQFNSVQEIHIKNHFILREELLKGIDNVRFSNKTEIVAQLEDCIPFDSLKWRVGIMERGIENLGRLVGDIDLRTRIAPVPLPDMGVAPPAAEDPAPAEGPAAYGEGVEVITPTPDHDGEESITPTLAE